MAHPDLARTGRIAGIHINFGADCAAEAVTGSIFPDLSLDGISAVPAAALVQGGVEDRLIAPAYWDWPHARLRETLDDFGSLRAEEFVERYEGAI